MIVAEGAFAESFLDDGSRGMFHNAATYREIYPDAAPSSDYCAPRVEEGPALEVIRDRLARLPIAKTRIASYGDRTVGKYETMRRRRA